MVLSEHCDSNVKGKEVLLGQELLQKIKEHKKKHGTPQTDNQTSFLIESREKHPELQNNILFHTLIGSSVLDEEKLATMSMDDPGGIINHYLNNFESHFIDDEFLPDPVKSTPKKMPNAQEDIRLQIASVTDI